MQLVLGAQVGAGLGAKGTPLSAPPGRWRLGERGRHRLHRAAWIAAFTLLGALGALQGATVAIGARGVSELASVDPRGTAATPRSPAAHELSRAFWRPAKSQAQRPPPEISPRRWQPARND